MTEEISPAARQVRYDVSDEAYAVVRRLYNGEEVDVPDHVLAEIEGVYGPIEWFKWYMEAFKTEFEKRVLGDVEDWKPTGFLSNLGAAAEVEHVRKVTGGVLGDAVNGYRPPVFATREGDESWTPAARTAAATADEYRSPIFAALESRVGKLPPALRAEPVADRVRRDLVPLVRAAAAEVPLPPLVPPTDLFVIHRPHQRGEHCWCQPWLIGSTVMHRDDNVPVSSGGYMLPDSMLADRHAVGCECVTCGGRP